MKNLINKFIKAVSKPVVLLPAITLALILVWQAYLEFSRGIDSPRDNLLVNGSFEELNTEGKPANWTVKKESGNADFTTEASQGYIGNHGLSVKVSDYQNGIVSIFGDPIKTESGASYFFKAYYFTNAAADLVAEYTYKDGSKKRELVRNYPDYDYPWSTMSGGVKVNDQVETVAFGVQLSSDASFEIDGAYVLKNTVEATTQPCSNQDSVVPNGSLSAPDNGEPQHWDPWQYGNNKASNVMIGEANNVYVRTEISEYTDGLAKWVYDPVAATAHGRYCVSLDYKSDVPVDVMAEFTATDGSKSYHLISTLLPTATWTRYTGTVETPRNTTSILVSAELSKVGFVETDNYQLVRLPGDGSTFNRPLISITFDDGWETSSTNGAKLADDYGFATTFYVNPGYIGEDDVMTFDQLKELLARGHQVASHGEFHIDLTAFKPEKVEADLKNSKKYIVDKLGINQVDLASPYGKHDARSDAIFKDLYASHRGTDLGINTKQNFDPYNLRVLFMRNETTLQEVQEYINDAKNNNGWFILVYHEIEDTDEPFIVSPSDLNDQLQVIQESGVTVKTVRDALVELQGQL